MRPIVVREIGSAGTFPARQSALHRGGTHARALQSACLVQAWRGPRRVQRMVWWSPGAPRLPADTSATFLWTNMLQTTLLVAVNSYKNKNETSTEYQYENKNKYGNKKK